MKRGEKRSQAQRDSDRATIAQLSLKGWTQVAIARYLELSQAKISTELKAVRNQWRESAIRDIALDKGRVLEKLALLQQEFWEAWEESKGKQESSLVERVELAAGVRTKQQKRTETESGNPTFLRAVLDCVKEEAKILDLYPSGGDSAHNTTAEQRGGGGGLSSSTVDEIRFKILGIADQDNNQNSNIPLSEVTSDDSQPSG